MMRRFQQFLILTTTLVLGGPAANAQIPAFPGAEGFGAYANGGRGGDVYYVMNLNTSGAGSFADAIATAPTSGRTIVFAVSGYIHVNKTSLSKSKITIAGQTAPGDGIGFKDGSFIINGSDVVIRHARFRYGDQAAGGDCINLDEGITNVILDHVSLTFSTDENISSFEQNPRPDLVTFQWSLNAWGLESHSCGGLWDLQRITTHHTLWAHHHTRNPKARPYGLLDWINNVTYDWGIGFIMGDSTTPAPWKANVRGNYFICPPGNLRSVALEKASIDRNGAYNFTLHVATNLFDKNGNTLLDGSDYGYGIASGSYQVSNAPIVVAGAQVPVATDAPLTAYKKIASRAGPLRLDALAGIPLRDEVDTILINNLVTLKRNHVSHESQTGASNNGMGFLNSTTAPVDTDRDGMPDYWENTLGWSAGSQDHNIAMANSGGFVTGLTFFPPNTPAGYTRLEEYLHFLAIPHATVPRNTTNDPTSFSVDLRRYTSGFNKAPVSFTVSNVTNGTVVLQPDGCTAVVTPTLNFAGRARFDFTVTDGDGSTWTQTLGVLVSSATLPRDLKWKGDGSANLWNTNALNFLDGTNLAAFVSGDNARFDDSGFNTPTVALGLTLSPGVVEVIASQDYSFGGVGSFAGAMKLVKNGAGTLTIGTTNGSLAGSIDLAGGSLTLLPGTSIGSGPMTLWGDAAFNLTAGGTIFPANPITIPAGESGTITSGSLGNALSGAVTGDSTSILRIGGSVSFNQTSPQFTAFPGTVQVPASSTLRFAGTSGSNGGVNTTFDVSGTLQMRNSGTTGHLGALTGSGTLGGAQTPSAGTVTYSVGAKDLSTTFAGKIVDANGPNTNTALVKVGSGTLTLAGTNTHTGTTTVSAGTLLINGTNTSSPVVVSSGAALGGNGRIGGLVNVNSGGRLAPGTTAVGTLTAVGSVTLNSPTMMFDLSGSPAGSNDRIAMLGGLLTMTGTQTYQFNLTEGQLSAGTYTLIDGGTNTSASSVSLVHNLPADARQTFALQRPASGNGQCYVQLVVTGNPTTLVWRGLADRNWDAATTNWVNGATPERFYNFDTVVFDDMGAAVPTINLTTAVNPAAIIVNTSTDRTFAGPGVLTGAGTLTKSGGGTLNIVNSNGTFSGNVMLTGGTLALGLGATFGTGHLTLAGGATFNLPPTTIKYSYAGNITVPARQVGTIYSPGLYNELFSAFISGDSNSVLNISGGVSIGGTTASQFDGFKGAIHIQPDATLRFSADSSGNTYGSLNPAFIIDGTLRPRNAGNTVRLGALSGTGSIAGPQSKAGAGNTTYLIGGNSLEVAFDGVISSNSAVAGSLVVLHKIGTAKLTLTGNSTYTGGTTVEAGSLIVNNTIGSGTGTGDLSVAGGASLGGSGYIGSPTTLEDLAILEPGNPAGTLTFNNDLDLGEFSVLNFELGSNSDAVVANAALSLAGTLNVIPTTGFGAGSYTLFSYNPTNTFNYSGLVLGTVPADFNYMINTDTAGQVKLIVTLPTPLSFGGISVAGGNVIFSGTGGTPGADYYVLITTNLTAPLASWVRLATNQFDSNGNFAWTNTPAPGNPRQFYRLTSP